MLLIEVADASAEMTATRSRLTKAEVVARVLTAATPEEVEVVACYLAGAPRQRRTGLGWRGLETLPPPAVEPSLEVSDVDAALERISGSRGGSRSARAALVADLFGRATETEQVFLRALVFENLRQGAQDSVLLDGIAKASGAR